MIKMTLYKTKIGRYYKLNDAGKQFIKENYYSMTTDELSETIGLSKPIIKRYATSIGYEKRKVGKEYKKFKNKVLEILRPYSGYLQYEEMRSILRDKHNIDLTRDQMSLLVKDSGIESSYCKGFIKVFIDGDKDNLEISNIILLTKQEYKYLSKIADISTLKGDALLTAIELARFRIAKNSIEEVYVAKNKKTGKVLTSNCHTGISFKLTKRKGQYRDCKSIGENGERFIRDWVVTREIRKRSRYWNTKKDN